MRNPLSSYRTFLPPGYWGVILLWIVFPGALAAQTFTLEVSKKNVVAGERFTARFVLEGTRAQPDFPDFAPLKVDGGTPSVASNFVMVNGRVSSSLSYTFYLRAPGAGTYTIPSASVTVRGKTLKTEAVRITATEAPPVSDPGDLAGQDVFIIPNLSKEEVFVGERLTVTYELFTQKSVRDLDLASNPVFDGFSVEANPNLAQFPRDVKQGKASYRVVNIRQYHLFPQQPGKADIPTLTFRAMVGTRSDPNDPFGVFNLSNRESRMLASARKAITVKPWPANPPADFSGLVGSFSMEAKLDATSLKAGETVRLRVRIFGEGNIRLQGKPELQLPESFDVFDPTPREAVRATAEAVMGEKVFDFLLAPREPGTFTLPPVTISYLDPESGAYETMRQALPTLTVTGQAISTNSESVVSPELEDDIRPLSQARARWYQTPGYGWVAVFLAPALLLAFFAIWLRRREREEALPETALRRSMAAARKQLAEAHKLLEQGDAKAFYNELNRTLWAYLADRLDLPGSSQTRHSLLHMLDTQKVDENLQAQLLGLLDASEMAVYAPGAVAPPADAYQKALAVLDQLENHLHPELA